MDLIIPVLILLAAILGAVLKKIDWKGAIAGVFLAILIWQGVGLVGLVALFLFFTFGTLASSIKSKTKKELHLLQDNEGKRGIANVLGNGGVSGFLSLLALVFPNHQELLTQLVVAGFATACSDTFSSEFGNVFGKRYFLITNLKAAPRGIDGAVSMQGLAFGIAGSLLIAGSLFFFQFGLSIVLLVTISGFAGNLFDSLLGATLQQKKYLNNHQVNFFATLFGSLFFLLCSFLIA